MLQLVDNTDVRFETLYESIGYTLVAMSGELNEEVLDSREPSDFPVWGGYN